jgi:hypothetical protein
MNSFMAFVLRSLLAKPLEQLGFKVTLETPEEAA